jgi:uncharacterized membrane protein
MEPDYPPRRGLILALLGMGIFYLVVTVLSLYYTLTFGAWRPYLVQIAGIALVVSIPITYLIWSVYEQRRGP